MGSPWRYLLRLLFSQKIEGAASFILANKDTDDAEELSEVSDAYFVMFVQTHIRTIWVCLWGPSDSVAIQ